MVDTPLQHCMGVGVGAKGVANSGGPWESLLKGAGKKGQADCRTSDLEEQCGPIPSWSWNNGQALYSGRGLGGGLGVQSVFCEYGEGIRLGPPGYSVGGAAGVWGEGSLLKAIQSLYSQSKSCVRVLRSKSGLLQVGVGLCQ